MMSGVPEERRRISVALVELVGSRGFSQTSVADVVGAAGVSEEAFHRHFADMEEAFVAVWDELNREHGALMAAAYDEHPDWRDRMRAMAHLTLDFLREDPIRARFMVLEVLNAGEVAQLHRDLVIAGQTALIDEGRQLLDDPDSVSPALAVHAAGAINEMLIRKTLDGDLFRGGDQVIRELLYLTMRPYVGDASAFDELEEPISSDD